MKNKHIHTDKEVLNFLPVIEKLKEKGKHKQAELINYLIERQIIKKDI